MLKVFGANVAVSKNFDDEDNPIRELGEDGKVISFRIGDVKHDTRAQDEKRWINVTVKASGAIAERVRKMKLKVGSTIILDGDLDIEKWKNKDDEEKKDVVIWLTGITYQYAGGTKREEAYEVEEETGKKSSSPKQSSKKKSSFQAYETDDSDIPF